MKLFFKKINLFKSLFENKFTTNEKLSRLTIFFIVILDIFIYITLSLGINFQTRILNNPNTIFPSECRSLLDQETEDFTKYYDKYGNNKYYNTIREKIADPRCAEIGKKYNAVISQFDIKYLIEEKNKLFKLEDKQRDELYSLKRNYNTVLTEKISQQNENLSILNVTSDNIKSKYTEAENNLNKIIATKDKMYSDFKNAPTVFELKNYIDNNKLQIKNDIEASYKYHSIKKELITILFLSPVAYLFFYLMNLYLRKEIYVQYIIFRNLFYVSLFPFVISILSLIYILLPKVFFEKLIKFFFQLEIPFVAYYILTAIFVFVFGLIIIKVQKRFKENNNKLKNNKINQIKFYNNSSCNNCGNKVDYMKMNFCPCCNNKLKEKCNCGEDKIVGLNYCYKCGS